MKIAKPEEIKRLRIEYPKGTRIELLQMDDPQAPEPGTKGTVLGVDDIGSIQVLWENGSRLNVIFGIDIIRKVTEK